MTSDRVTAEQLAASADLIEVNPDGRGGFVTEDRRPLELRTLAELRRAGVKVAMPMVAVFRQVEQLAGVKDPLPDTAVKIILTDLLDRFKWLTVVDYITVMKRLRQGDFGAIYGTLSQIKVFDAFKAYEQERLNTADEANFNRHLQRKSGTGAAIETATMERHYAAMRRQAEKERQAGNRQEHRQQDDSTIDGTSDSAMRMREIVANLVNNTSINVL